MAIEPPGIAYWTGAVYQSRLNLSLPLELSSSWWGFNLDLRGLMTCTRLHVQLYGPKLKSPVFIRVDEARVPAPKPNLPGPKAASRLSGNLEDLDKAGLLLHAEQWYPKSMRALLSTLGYPRILVPLKSWRRQQILSAEELDQLWRGGRIGD